MAMNARERVFSCGCGDETPGVLHYPTCPLRKTPPPSAHPERKPGQRWRCKDDEHGDVTEGVLLSLLGGDWTVQVGDHEEVWMDSFRWGHKGCTMTLLSDTPAPASRAGCKAFCGHHNLSDTYRDNKPKRPDVFYGDDRDLDRVNVDGSMNWIAWCSLACRDARLPPIEAPAEANCDCGQFGRPPHFRNHRCVAQPKPAKPKVALCGCGQPAVMGDGSRGYCEACSLVQPKVVAKVEPTCSRCPLPSGQVARFDGREIPLCLLCLRELHRWNDAQTPTNTPPKPGPLPITDWLDDWLPEAGR